MTEYIATRWYRPPEVLLEWDSYSKSLDVWSIGCIFAELIERKPLFQGNDSSHQIELIIMTLGTPKIEDIYKDGRLGSRELIYKFGKVEKLNWKDILPKATDDAIDLLESMLKFDPDKRVTVDEAMKHKYFDDLPKEADEKAEPVSKFDFEFEDQDLNINELRDLILHEIMLYHDQTILDEYEKAKEQYKKGERKKDKTSMLKSGSKNIGGGSKSSKSKIG